MKIYSNLDKDAKVGFYDSKADFVSKVLMSSRKGSSSLAFLDTL